MIVCELALGRNWVGSIAGACDVVAVDTQCPVGFISDVLHPEETSEIPGCKGASSVGA